MSLFKNITTSVDLQPTTTANMSIENPSEPVGRYSKRKRAQITYTYSDDEDDFLEDEEDFEPHQKKAKKVVKNLPKHKIFPFMNLPAELRNKIYEYALSDEGGIAVVSKTKGYRRLAQRCVESECTPQYTSRYSRYRPTPDEDTIERRSFAPNLLAVSKVIHMEGASYLYSQPITIADNYALMVFLNQIGPQHVSMLQDITVKEWLGGRSHKALNFPALAMLIPATKLRRLNIACVVGYYGNYWNSNRKQQPVEQKVARKVFRDCFPFLEAYGRSKGRMDAGVDVIEIAEENFRNSGKEVEKMHEGFRRELSKLLHT